MSFISTLWEWLSKDRIRDWAFHWSFRLSIWGKIFFRFILLRAQTYLESQRSLSQTEHPSATCLRWHESLSSWPSCPRPPVYSSRWPSWFSAERSIPVFCFQSLLFPLQAENQIKDWRQNIYLEKMLLLINYLVLSIWERSYPRLCSDQVGWGCVTNHDFIHRNWN